MIVGLESSFGLVWRNRRSIVISFQRAARLGFGVPVGRGWLTACLVCSTDYARRSLQPDGARRGHDGGNQRDVDVDVGGDAQTPRRANRAPSSECDTRHGSVALRRANVIPGRTGSNGIDIEPSRHHTVSVSNFQSIDRQLGG